MNTAILYPEVQDFINRHLQADVTRMLFGKSPFKDVTTRELAMQIESKLRAEKKLPSWFNTPLIYYPPKLSMEQASSEKTAAYKSTVLKGKKIIDLTGGFGADSFAFSKIADEVVHCESNEALSEIAGYNASVMGIANIRFIKGDGINYLKQTDEKFDVIYIDPSRRVNSHKIFKLSDCEPNILEHINLLFSKSPRITVKTSPLLDIRAGLDQLKKVSEIHVVSVKNDCKELLWILDNGQPHNSAPQVTCAMLEPFSRYSFSIAEEHGFEISAYSAPLAYIYEPDVALLKAGCFKLITRDFNVQKIHQHTHLYTSESINSLFPGRIFRLKAQWTYKDFLSVSPVSKANMICRNFPLSTEEVKRKSRIKDGGAEFLLFITGPSNELLVLNCERMQ